MTPSPASTRSESHRALSRLMKLDTVSANVASPPRPSARSRSTTVLHGQPQNSAEEKIIMPLGVLAFRTKVFTTPAWLI